MNFNRFKIPFLLGNKPTGALFKRRLSQRIKIRSEFCNIIFIKVKQKRGLAFLTYEKIEIKA
jgi:hypothetical protein